MVETGYRYQEMFWGGLDGNWEYANYQLNKMELAIKPGIERRPKRGKSASFFLNETLPSLRADIEKRDSSMFAKQMEILTVACNSCHATEKVSFFHVQIPNERRSPIR